jgi:hypothetical protein
LDQIRRDIVDDAKRKIMEIPWYEGHPKYGRDTA